ncbi:hypothetical protein [Phytohabitans kaempferiae]|uniref:Uncharacterized protein n=1 Tax=Phytohabitans kaempferiae TaxID=1620943 RepID=A0ABV6M935_9ACTN
MIDAEVGEFGVFAGELVPDDDGDGSPDGDDGYLLAGAAGDAPVAFAEQRRCA